MAATKLQRLIAEQLVASDPARRGLKTHDLAKSIEVEVEDVLRALRKGYVFFEPSPWRATSGAEKWRLRPGVRIVDGEPVMAAGSGVDRQTALCRICGAEVPKGAVHECGKKE